jgi:peptidoglycan/LPS O-acetylase OafA/YrhL
MTLHHGLSGRDNNLNLLRFLAAVAVLVSHAYPISLGPKAAEPLEAALGVSLGHIAVLVFFAASGYLIASSFERSPTLGVFLRARFARLVPGLAVSLAVVALVIGTLVTSFPVGTYLTHPETASFVLRNLALVKPQFHLPGVFSDNPYPTIEGSIWTLKYEVACYVGVFLAGVVGLLARRVMASVALCLFLAVAITLPVAGVKTFTQLDSLLNLGQPFAVGVLFYLWRTHVRASLGILAVCAGVSWLLRTTPLYEGALMATISYGTFVLAVIPGGAIRAFNQVGDFSYGVYIYAFPVQGLVVWAFGPVSPVENMLLSLPPTLGLAILSWYLVEKPALDWARPRRPAPQGSSLYSTR